MSKIKLSIVIIILIITIIISKNLLTNYNNNNINIINLTENEIIKVAESFVKNKLVYLEPYFQNGSIGLKLATLIENNFIKNSNVNYDDIIIISKKEDSNELVFSYNKECNLNCTLFSTIPIDFFEEKINISPIIPKLTTNLLPIKRNESNTAWIIADKYEQWFSYKEQQWANAILVGNQVRHEYVVGKEVLEKDVLAYYVWIPRFEYQLFNIKDSNNYTRNDKQQIQINFVNKTIAKKECLNGMNNCQIGEWITHPAFSLIDDNNEITELDGFWIGKFELSGTNDLPTIIPNVPSLRSMNLKPLFDTIKKFNKNKIYGLIDNISIVDSHMLKNMEWGAVAYLTRSKYGQYKNINNLEELWPNPCNNYLTGFSGNNNKSSNEICVIGTNDYSSINGIKASTTGNIYGVYDMSGGSYEYVMGVMNSKPLILGKEPTYNTIRSEFDNTNMPNPKYYNLYDFSTNFHTIKDFLNGQYGDGTFEFSPTNNSIPTGWDNDYCYMPYSIYPWFVRGGLYTNGSGAGIGSLFTYVGRASIDGSTRAALWIF